MAKKIDGKRNTKIKRVRTSGGELERRVIWLMKELKKEGIEAVDAFEKAKELICMASRDVQDVRKSCGNYVQDMVEGVHYAINKPMPGIIKKVKDAVDENDEDLRDEIPDNGQATTGDDEPAQLLLNAGTLLSCTNCKKVNWYVSQTLHSPMRIFLLEESLRNYDLTKDDPTTGDKFSYDTDGPLTLIEEVGAMLPCKSCKRKTVLVVAAKKKGE